MRYILPFFLLASFSLSAKSLGRKYYVNFLGHVHKNPSKDSSSLTVLQCSHSVKILKSKSNVPNWTYVEVGEDKGYIQTRFLSNKRPKCLQEKYPKFYLGLDLDITEMYFWGRLYDQYFQGRSKIK
ncbi:MAG: SH3 domain-containing protein [Bacteriovoracaceae bacterium]|nr:SH3 domain-containing protein [Bacteriovoracaceae bacterium]